MVHLLLGGISALHQHSAEKARESVLSTSIKNVKALSSAPVAK
jgi:hypothetical protein